jgi:hypothetical protein
MTSNFLAFMEYKLKGASLGVSSLSVNYDSVAKTARPQLSFLHYLYYICHCNRGHSILVLVPGIQPLLGAPEY